MTEHIWAARRGDLGLIRSELAGGASMREGIADLMDLMGPGDEPESGSEELERELDFFAEILSESMESAGLGARNREVLLSHGEEYLWWPVVYAAQSRECSDDAFDAILQWTVDEGPLDSHQGAQALNGAARLGLIRRVRSLLAAGADPNGCVFLGSAVPNALPYQKSDGAVEALRVILETGEFRGKARVYLVNQAVGCGNSRAVELLRDEGDVALAEGLVEQHGALGHALIYGQFVDATALEAHSDTEDGLFYVAACLDRLDVVSRHLPGREHQYGRVLKLAARAGSSAVLGWCLERAATEEQLQETFAGAASYGSGVATELLLDAGVIPLGDTIADAGGDAARVLARRKLAIDTIGSDGFTMLRTAAGEGDHELVTFLLEHGADPNARSEGLDFTALGFAASMEWARCVDVLLKYGADPMIRDLDGDRPVDCARSQHLKRRLMEAMK